MADPSLPRPPAGADADLFDVVRAGAKTGDAVIALAERVDGTIKIARALIENGRTVDLAGLDREVGVLSAQALDLAPEEGRKLRIRLIELLGELDRLTEALRQGGPSPR